MCAKLDNYPAGQYFKISIWASFTWSMGTYQSSLSSGAGESKHLNPLSCFLIIIALKILWTWASLVFKASCFGGLSLGHRSQQLEFKPFSPQGEALDFEFHPDCRLLHWDWSLWWNCISASPTCFDVSLLSLAQCIAVAETAFRFFRGICSIFSCRFSVPTGGGEPRMLHCHLELELPVLNFEKTYGKLHSLFFRVHVCSPKQHISPTADASCNLNGAPGCHFWRNWHVGKKWWKLWDYDEPFGKSPTHGRICRQLPDERWEDPGR